LSHGGHLEEFPIGKRFTIDRKSNMAARANNVFSLAEILKIFLSETTKSIELHGGHLEFPIGKRQNTNLVENHPVNISGKFG
jgi:hypothetical protein